MKLTKGKISKLYNKKKQSFKKKVNKKKVSNRNKTFRKKRNIHLARKSLKRFHYKKQRGGVKDGEEEGMPKVDEVSTSVTENTNQPSSETLNQSTENVDPIVDSSATSMATENVEPIVDSSATSMETNNVETPIDFSAVSSEANNVETPVDFSAVSSEPENVDNSLDSSSVSLETNDDIPMEDDDISLSTKTLNITEPVDTTEIEEEKPFKPIDFSNTTIKTENEFKPIEVSSKSLEPSDDLTSIQSNKVPSKQELMNSLSNVVDYITDAVAEKVSVSVTSTQSGENQQNGFDSVNAAAEMMAKSGGKRRKTRKFKLSKKNKTKKA